MTSAVTTTGPLVIAIPAMSREVTITAEWREKLNTALTEAKAITTIATADENLIYENQL